MSSRKSNEQFKEEIFNIVGDEYTVLGEYTGANKKVTFKHNTCGHEFDTKASHFLNTGTRCPICSRKKRSHDNYIKLVESLVGDEYTVLGEYVSVGEPLLMRHEECNTKYMVRPNAFLRGSRCPRCVQSSRGEDRIIRYLEDNNIEFTSQFKIEECKNKKPLPFDFAIYDNENLVVLIEYQGEQHYKIVEHFGGEQGFEERQYNDKIKKSFCKNNNIPLLEIPFWNYDDIENIIEGFMKKRGNLNDSNRADSR